MTSQELAQERARGGRDRRPERRTRLTTAQALIRWLQAQHSERDGEVQRAIPALFAIFGHGNVAGIGQAIRQEGGELPLFQPKNEQAMVHTALGFAKASRRLQTLACSASIGPGATNMLTGAATATTNRLPVLLLPADTFASRFQGHVLQQLEHPLEADTTVNDAFRPLSRFFDRVARPEQLLTALPEAMRVLLDPAETGAVTIALHQDVQGEAFDYPERFFASQVWSVPRRPVAEAELAAATALLATAARPLVIAGGGVRHSAAEAELRAFAEAFGFPVAETSAGKGSLPADCPWLVGGIGVNGTRAANELARDADAIVCVGTRLSDFTTGSNTLFERDDVQLVQLNVNAADAARRSRTPLVGDAREALTALTASLRRAGRSVDADYAGEVQARTEAWGDLLAQDLATRPGQSMSQGEVLRVLNEAARAGDWVVAAAGWQPGDLLKSWATPPGSFTHIEFGFSCMGHEIPAALGIRMHGGDDGEVFAVVGDGTFLMNPTELVTAVQERLKITVVLIDNGGYGSIDGLAVGRTGGSVGNMFRARGDDGRFPDGERVVVDFAANAASMGCEATVAETADALRRALAAARGSAAPTVIVCPVKGRPLIDAGASWEIGVAEVVDEGGER
jgi:3D-(3,5/4)-trihydroxycyclohexane-1,2-dione acylhydrolase (decyclizing)